MAEVESISEYVREQSLLMATDTHTPIGYYAEMPIHKLVEWIITANNAFEKRNKAIEEARRTKKK